MLFFLLFQCYAEKEYQMESKRNETFVRIVFGTNAIQENWSGRQGSNEAATRQGGAPPPSWAPRSSTDLLLPRIYIHIPRKHPGAPVRESWIRGCPDGRTIPSAGHLDYEDTRLKTSSRVRKGLSLAWKASLAIRICRSPTIVTDSV